MDTNSVQNIAAPERAPVAGDGAAPGAVSAPHGGRATVPSGRGRRAETLIGNTVAYVLLAIGSVLFALPFLFMVSTALKSVDEANEFPPKLLPMRQVTVTLDGREYPVGRLPDGREVALLRRVNTKWEAVGFDRTGGGDVRVAGEPAFQVEVAQVEPVKRLHARLVNFPQSLTQEGMPFGRFFWNTLIIVGLTVFGATFSAALCAYGFARLRFRGREPLFILLLSTMMIPGQVTMIPVYIMFKELHWINTYLPLIVPAWFGGGAFSIFLLRQFFQSIPYEMEEAARIDGAGPLGTWWRIILPLSLPAMATVAIFTFMGSWNDFMGPLIYLNDTDKFTLALGLNLFKGQYGTDTPHLMMAATLVVLAPVLILFFFAQKHFIQGIVVSGVKG